MISCLKNVKEKSDEPNHISLWTRVFIFIVSFSQAYWIPIASAATTVAAATMFGDKAYWCNIDQDVEKMATQKTPAEMVKYIGGELDKYAKWRKEYPDQVQQADESISNLYFQLAKAKESTGVPKKSLIDDYKHAVFSPNHTAEAMVWLFNTVSPEDFRSIIIDKHKRGAFLLDHSGEAMTWLFNNVSLDEYKRIIAETTKKPKVPGMKYGSIAKQFESGKQWQVFEAFLDVLFTEAKDSVPIASDIGASFTEDSEWKDKFDKYCRMKPNLIQYTYKKDCRTAEERVAKEDFKSAAGIYKDILKYDPSPAQRPEIEFKICEYLFKSGEYKAALAELNQFTVKNKSERRTLIIEAILMKGQIYIQVGEVKKAIDEFSALLIEYPEAKQSPDASFFIGYCCMLQEKFEQAKDAFALVVKDYPQSSYANKAKLCLSRIETIAK